MIRLITGLPGAGKTSNTLAEFLQIQGRPKYATFINGFDYAAHNVVPLDKLDDWQDLPDGSLVFCDEAQQFLRPRGPKDKVPEWIAAFETHRHRGFDFWLTTQNPMLIDIHVRRLTGEHWHYYRPFGFKSVSLLKWEEVKDNPRDPREIQLAQKSRVKLPPSVFQHYKSTVVDTHKPKIPRKLIYMLSALLIGFALVAAGVFKLADRADSMLSGVAPGSTEYMVPSQPVAAPVPSQGQGQGQGLYAGFNGLKDRPLTAADFEAVHPLAPWSAPFYREVAKPVTFPRFSGCAAFNGQCKCFTQQATVIEVDQAMCLDVVVKNKMPFNPHKPDSENQAHRVASVATGRPVSQVFSDPVDGGAASLPSSHFIPRNPL